MRDIWRRVAAAGGAKIFAMGVLTLTIFISARWLGPSGRGVAAAVATWAMVVGTLVHFSLGQVALQHRASGQTHEFGTVVGTLLVFAALMTALAWLAIVGLAAIPGGPLATIPRGPLALGMCAVPFVVWEQYDSYLLMSIDRLPVYNRAQVLGRSAELALVVMFVALLGYGVKGAIVGDVIGQATVSTIGIRVLLRRAEYRLGFDGTLLWRLLSAGVRLHFSAVGTLLVTYVDVLIIQRYLGARETGLYQLAVQGATLMLVLPQAAAQVMYSRVATLGPDDAWPHQRSVIVGLLALLAAGGGAAALLAPVVIPSVVGAEFLPTVPIFRVLIFSVLGRALGFMMGPQWIGRGLFWQASFVTVAIGLLDVALALVLVPRVGVFGAAYASVTAYTIGAAVNGALGWHIGRRLRRNAQHGTMSALAAHS